MTVFTCRSVDTLIHSFFYIFRQSNKEANKEEQILQEKLALQAAFDDMAFRIEKQDVQLRELRRLIYSLGTVSKTPPITCIL